MGERVGVLGCLEMRIITIWYLNGNYMKCLSADVELIQAFVY